MSVHPTVTPHAGAPFGVMLRGALVPSAACGVVTSIAYAALRGPSSGASAFMGAVVAVAFFATGMLLLSRLVRSANPFAFLAVGMAVYLGQVLALLVFMIAFRDRAWVDGPALGIAALVVTLTWQVFAIRAFRAARLPVYDEAALDPVGGRS
ncbi:MAG: hypothetical protein U0Q21_05965 [Dermatophilaceae bacterium]